MTRTQNLVNFWCVFLELLGFFYFFTKKVLLCIDMFFFCALSQVRSIQPNIWDISPDLKPTKSKVLVWTWFISKEITKHGNNDDTNDIKYWSTTSKAYKRTRIIKKKKIIMAATSKTVVENVVEIPKIVKSLIIDLTK